MTISERLFHIMDDKQISMPELSRMTGISRHTIFDWQRRKTNPGADKICVFLVFRQRIRRRDNNLIGIDSVTTHLIPLFLLFPEVP